ncbi:MerC family mercury resistance protein [Haliea sp. AH-315-K21]|nr:MerC family mercury resistance protein [Haliea sp. AH-315-K21]
MWKWVIGLGDKVGFSGSFIAALGCPACFPALAGISSAIGLSFLSQWEGILVSRVLPLIALIVLIINILGFFSHHQWHRTLLGIVGPTLVIIGAREMNQLFLFPGLAFMFGVSVWDIVSSRHKRCETASYD